MVDAVFSLLFFSFSGVRVKMGVECCLPVDCLAEFLDGLEGDSLREFDAEFRYCVDGFLDESGERFWAPVLMEQGGRLLYCRDLFTMRVGLDRSGIVDGETDPEVIDEVLECWECGHSFSGWWRMPALGGMRPTDGRLKRGKLNRYCRQHDEISEYLFVFWLCGLKLGYGGVGGPLERSLKERWRKVDVELDVWKSCGGNMFGSYVSDGVYVEKRLAC